MIGMKFFKDSRKGNIVEAISEPYLSGRESNSGVHVMVRWLSDNIVGAVDVCSLHSVPTESEYKGWNNNR